MNEGLAETGVSFGLVVVDTIAAAAGWRDEQDNAEAQSVMNVLRRVSRATGALVVAVDHYGKSIEAGTRGGSAKEGAADAVLALLGEKRESGLVENRRMAVRKLRGGTTGGETAFNLRVVEIGTDPQGRPITTCAVDWAADGKPRVPAPDPWPKSARLLREILTDAPSSYLDKEAVRAEFYARYPADGTDKQRNDAKRQALARGLRDAAGAGLLTERETGGGVVIALSTGESDLSALTAGTTEGSVTGVTMSQPVTVAERDKRDRGPEGALSVTQRADVTDLPAGSSVTAETPLATGKLARLDPLALYAAKLRQSGQPVPETIKAAVRDAALQVGAIPPNERDAA